WNYTSINVLNGSNKNFALLFAIFNFLFIPISSIFLLILKVNLLVHYSYTRKRSSSVTSNFWLIKLELDHLNNKE
ncbi:hypothetical protein, partial [Bacillus licheniformis]|uniref:hypothetical protein n=1 Tax=Bacillus licheniformis TaxID=1402 RepID=UPI002E206338|nr:hypothetical protein [Bacillus licheniformis]